jgi:hypothetical protein
MAAWQEGLRQVSECGQATHGALLRPGRPRPVSPMLQQVCRCVPRVAAKSMQNNRRIAAGDLMTIAT